MPQFQFVVADGDVTLVPSADAPSPLTLLDRASSRRDVMIGTWEGEMISVAASHGHKLTDRELRYLLNRSLPEWKETRAGEDWHLEPMPEESLSPDTAFHLFDGNTPAGELMYTLYGDLVWVQWLFVQPEYRHTDALFQLVAPIRELMNQGYQLDAASYYTNPRLRGVVERYLTTHSSADDEADLINAVSPPGEGDQSGFLMEPHTELYPPIWEGHKMRPHVKQKIEDYLLQAISEGGFNSTKTWLKFTAFGSGASYNWNEAGDFDVHIWVDVEAFNAIHPDLNYTSDQLLVALRRLIVPINSVPLAKITDKPENKMLVQYYPLAGKGTKDECLATRPYACYDMQTDEWFEDPKPITPDFYGEWFLIVEPKARLLANQANSILDSLDLNQIDAMFWGKLFEKYHNPKYQQQANNSKTLAEQDWATVRTMWKQLFDSRQEAYSPAGGGLNDERDMTGKILEVWGIGSRLKERAYHPLPWQDQELPAPPPGEDPEPTPKFGPTAPDDPHFEQTNASWKRSDINPGPWDYILKRVIQRGNPVIGVTGEYRSPAYYMHPNYFATSAEAADAIENTMAYYGQGNIWWDDEFGNYTPTSITDLRQGTSQRDFFIRNLDGRYTLTHKKERLGVFHSPGELAEAIEHEMARRGDGAIWWSHVDGHYVRTSIEALRSGDTGQERPSLPWHENELAWQEYGDTPVFDLGNRELPSGEMNNLSGPELDVWHAQYNYVFGQTGDPVQAVKEADVAVKIFRNRFRHGASPLDPQDTSQGVQPICMYCGKFRTPDNSWTSVNPQPTLPLSHTICPDCMRIQHPEMWDKINNELGGWDQAMLSTWKLAGPKDDMWGRDEKFNPLRDPPEVGSIWRFDSTFSGSATLEVLAISSEKDSIDPTIFCKILDHHRQAGEETKFNLSSWRIAVAFGKLTQIEGEGQLPMLFSAYDNIQFINGDITQQPVDAIVNAANAQLRPGAGVDGAIRAADGGIQGQITQETAQIGGCPTGDAVTTSGGALPAKWIIHAVGPIWSGGESGEAEHLASAYYRAMEEASKIGARSIAFPALSCGIYMFPTEQAAQIALNSLEQAMHAFPEVSDVCIVFFDPKVRQVFDEVKQGGTVPDTLPENWASFDNWFLENPDDSYSGTTTLPPSWSRVAGPKELFQQGHGGPVAGTFWYFEPTGKIWEVVESSVDDWLSQIRISDIPIRINGESLWANRSMWDRHIAAGTLVPIDPQQGVQMSLDRTAGPKEDWQRDQQSHTPASREQREQWASRPPAPGSLWMNAQTEQEHSGYVEWSYDYYGTIIEVDRVGPTEFARGSGGDYVWYRFLNDGVHPTEHLYNRDLQNWREDILEGLIRPVPVQDIQIAISKIATWADVAQKAQRLRQQGSVHILRNAPDIIVGRVDGDHGTYTTQIWRDDPNSLAITEWDCECQWSDFSWQRTRQWKKYEGRPCSHVLALFWEALASPVEGQPDMTGGDQGDDVVPTAAPAQPQPGGPVPAEVPQGYNEQLPYGVVSPGTMPAGPPIPGASNPPLPGAAGPPPAPAGPPPMPAGPPPGGGATSKPTPPGQGGTVSIPGALSSWKETKQPFNAPEEWQQLPFEDCPECTSKLETYQSGYAECPRCGWSTENDHHYGPWSTDVQSSIEGELQNMQNGEFKKTCPKCGDEPMNTLRNGQHHCTQCGYIGRNRLEDLPKFERDSGWKYAGFVNGDNVRAEKDMQGLDRDNNTITVPRNSIGEVLFSDAITTIAIFPLRENGPLEPHLVKVEDFTSNFVRSNRPNPFIRRRT